MVSSFFQHLPRFADGIVVLLVAALNFAHPTKDWDAPEPEWYRGPVRYLITGDEEKRFRSLGTREQRIRFIEDFWARRDEDPGTPVNETQIRFRQRVAEADRLFRDAPYPGWKTDRGKLYILLGAPDEIRQGSAFNRLGKEYPYEIWIYEEPRFEGMSRDTELRFVRDDSGEFRLTDRLFLSRLEIFSGAPRSLAYRALDAQRPPEPRELLDTVVSARPALDPKRFRTHYDFFKAVDGSTSVFLTLGVKIPSPDDGDTAPRTSTAPEPRWKVYARLAGPTGTYDLVEAESFRTESDGLEVDGFRLYQSRISLPAAEYTVFYAVQDEATGEVFPMGERLQVPEFGTRTLSLSGITLASRIQVAETAGAERPFHIGRLQVIPKVKPEYSTGGMLGFYFQVYNAESDEETGRAHLDLTYQFYQATEVRKTGELTYAQFGQAVRLEDQSGQVHGHTFPLTEWPAGEYRLRVTVADRLARQIVEADTDFSVR